MASEENEEIQFNQLERMKYIQQLRETQWDIIVIGGGVTGAGIAREAIARGLSVAVLDKCDFAFGTSSRSTKLAHGGIRYLSQGEYGLVREATTERNWLRETGLPHLTRPSRFLYPLLREGRDGSQYLPGTKSRGTMRLATFLYSLLCGFKSYRRGKTTKDIERIKEMEPLLESSRLKGAACWYDSNINDARLVIETLKDAIWHGPAIALNYLRVIGLTHNTQGRIIGIQAIDETDPQKKEISVRGKIVVNATGVWADDILAIKGNQQEKMIRPTKGIHLIYHQKDFPVNSTFAMHSVDDDRIIFVIRRNDWVIVGTTDTDYSGDPAECYATREDADYLRNTMSVLFPEAKINDEKIQGTYAGLRPLIAEPGKTESEASRKHVILEREDGLLSIIGGKLTIFRLMAEDLFRKHIEKAKKAFDLPKLRSGKNLTKTQYAIALTKDKWQAFPEVSRSKLHSRILHHLYEQYGRGGLKILREIEQNPELANRILDNPAYPIDVCPWIVAEVDYVVQHEAPLHLEDVLCRRLEISWLVRPEYQGIIAAVTASRMGSLLGWSQEHRNEEIQSYLEYVRKNCFFFKGAIPIPDIL